MIRMSMGAGNGQESSTEKGSKNTDKLNMAALRVSFFLLLSLVFSNALSWSQGLNFDVSLAIDWARKEMNAQTSFNLAEAGIRLPNGRFMGEEILSRAFPRLLRPAFLSIRVDSNSTVRDLIDRGEISLEDLDRLSLAAEQIPPSLSLDLTRMNGRYRVFMEGLNTLLMQHRRVTEPERPLIPVPSANHTGIIIIADGELPIHGRRTEAFVEPSLFPKIWDSNMNIIYEKNMMEPGRGFIVRYTTRDNIFRPTPSGLEGELAAFLGPNPLRILARGVFGINPTDPIIDRDDAMLILSNENNRRLLREGRVLFVLHESQLTSVMHY